jgi:carboxyl-terminal processing protease
MNKTLCHFTISWLLIAATLYVISETTSRADSGLLKLVPPATGEPASGTNTNEQGRLGMMLHKVGSDLQITHVEPGSPAWVAGLKRGQTITSINNVSTVNMQAEDAAKLTQGPVGSKVELEVLKPGRAEPQHLQLTREVVVPIHVENSILNSNIGLLTVYDFSIMSPGIIKEVLDDFREKQVSGVVLDLRNNDGGSFKAITDVAGFFLGMDQLVCIFHNRENGNPVKKVSSQPNVWSGPMVVLVGGETSSGAEVFAAALQVHGRAKLLGQTTSGYANISALQKQPDGTLKKVVVGSMFTAADKEVTGKGIKPDVAVSESLSPEEVLSNAVEMLQKSNPAGTEAKPDVAERLKKVKELYDQGLINKQDYDKKVKEIMDSL